MYSIFVQLCKERGVSTYQAAKDAHIGQSTISEWRLGTSVPRDKTLRKLADYFGVTLEYMKGESQERYPDGPTASELNEVLEVLRTRSDMRMLFSLAKDATPEDVRRAAAIIEALRGAENHD